MMNTESEAPAAPNSSFIIRYSAFPSLLRGQCRIHHRTSSASSANKMLRVQASACTSAVAIRTKARTLNLSKHIRHANVSARRICIQQNLYTKYRSDVRHLQHFVQSTLSKNASLAEHQDLISKFRGHIQIV